MECGIKRKEGRASNELRPIFFERNYTRYAEGSVLAVAGLTKVLCTATVEEKVPAFLKGLNQGWVTAEYSMLPRSTDRRTGRASAAGISGRSAEIQRLVGRVLRSVVDRTLLGARTITIDCDVIQADGGTRVTSINGGFLALVDALRHLVANGVCASLPLSGCISAVSAGKIGDLVYLDLDADEDRAAAVDFNVAVNHKGEFVEVQGTGEQGFFSRKEADMIFDLTLLGCEEIRKCQRAVLAFSEEEENGLAF